MYKQIIIAGIVIFGYLSAAAQEKKVAVFDPAGSVEASVKEIVREEISSIIVNTGEYTVLERQLIDKVLEENKFQAGGLVDDSQISEIGKRMGASYVLVTSITKMGTGGNYYISCKMIEVQTARIDRQKTMQTKQGMNDLVPVTQKAISEMFRYKMEIPEQPYEEPKQQQQRQTQPQSQVFALSPDANKMLVATGKNVFVADGRKLNKYEVKNLMANTFALNVYEKGLSQNKMGNIGLISGICLTSIGGLLFATAEESYEQDAFYSSGMIIGGVGVGLTVVGIVLKSKGKKTSTTLSASITAAGAVLQIRNWTLVLRETA